MTSTTTVGGAKGKSLENLCHLATFPAGRASSSPAFINIANEFPGYDHFVLCDEINTSEMSKFIVVFHFSRHIFRDDFTFPREYDFHCPLITFRQQVETRDQHFHELFGRKSPFNPGLKAILSLVELRHENAIKSCDLHQEILRAAVTFNQQSLSVRLIFARFGQHCFSSSFHQVACCICMSQNRSLECSHSVHFDFFYHRHTFATVGVVIRLTSLLSLLGYLSGGERLLDSLLGRELLLR